MHHEGPQLATAAVSVVIPVKDDADGLRRCLRALALQTRPADEIIVVDNGSTDASASVARDGGAVVVVCHEPGIPAAAAAGYDAAQGDLILRLDADCIPAASWVDAMTSAAHRMPEVAVFAGGARFIDGPRWLRSSLALCYLGAYAAVLTPTLGHVPVFGSNFAIRRTAWRAVSPHVHRLDPELHDDLDLAFHVGGRHRVRPITGAAMGMSMRPFASARAFRRRIARGVRTVVRHWPHEFPPVRWVRLAASHRDAVHPPAATGVAA
ncbi:glycosyltransferase family 2 protein [Microbacterium sp. EYE_5]|uniref:glycosyltransferase family 2 protein n=1 Tax=unclassified Microbacterium TaxID=2609290 RepID=UPI002002B442|nr:MULTISPECIES: glycosyltransferase family A protein [unclassified Microbacterium]MCK6080935.1 glycosyltransferase family 2 protein [Microbacterium sp. EYE_382]MCK6086206.1 glycosyltransferase family 2 protein [Microbacterium sp. EYE_384]MCK6124296.1 glycosyltransferase family 2 protein [Microbacterium sp. EYE_80]MCK6127205.1 glycosyltransferase family 2 protein [Microbacterium sp. EYE_79]MCK6141890.1 glycosyltransferase family 2 protein [Microbacterium sp. EYE_39]